jgi:hypothetical protein
MHSGCAETMAADRQLWELECTFPQKMTAKMQYLELSSKPKRSQLLGQAQERTGKTIGSCETQIFKASWNG